MIRLSLHVLSAVAILMLVRAFWLRIIDYGTTRDLWVPAALTILSLVTLYCMAYRPLTLAVHHHRRHHGKCIECGYDLRGSDGCCPECGHTMEPAK